jgi:hypothetical protein
MPDPDIAAAANVPAESRPSRQVSPLRLPRISNESFRGSPILKQRDRSAKPDMTAQKTEFGLAPKLRQHARHRKKHRQPLVKFQGAIDSHPD